MLDKKTSLRNLKKENYCLENKLHGKPAPIDVNDYTKGLRHLNVESPTKF